MSSATKYLPLEKCKASNKQLYQVKFLILQTTSSCSYINAYHVMLFELLAKIYFLKLKVKCNCMLSKIYQLESASAKIALIPSLVLFLAHANIAGTNFVHSLRKDSFTSDFSVIRAIYCSNYKYKPKTNVICCIEIIQLTCIFIHLQLLEICSTNDKWHLVECTTNGFEMCFSLVVIILYLGV